jgi:uncharacterized protein YndB with AHSA1/START domain
MKWVLIAIGILALLIVVIVAIGYMLPRDHVAQVTRRHSAPPETVWAAMTDVERFAAWRTDLVSVERLSSADGKLRWKEKTKHDALTMEVTESDAPRRLVTRIADEGLPFGGTWTYELAPDGAGTVLTITENGSVYNPLFRFVSRFVMGHTATLDKYQSAMAKGLAARLH